MQAVILAGGLAKRMWPLTEKIPKALLDVAGRPFVDWQLEKLKSCGFDDVVLCVAHLGDQIRAHVGDGGRYGLCVRYSDEGETLLGTAGAMRRAATLLDPTFLVTYGDSYLPFDYGDPLRMLDAHADCQGVMSVFRNAGKWDPSNVLTDGEWVIGYVKGTKDPAYDHIDYGAIAMRRDVITALALGVPAGLETIQQSLAEKKLLRALVAHDRFFEIGSPEGLGALTKHLSS